MRHYYILLFIFIVIIGLFFYYKNKTATFTYYTIENYTELNQNEKYQTIQLINEINDHNSKIVNIQTQISINVVGNPLVLRGHLYHQKELYFRMKINSIIAKELDIGSNLSVFWFWSRRMSPSILYYTQHKNLYKTHLKNPFNPLWMIECLNVGQIDFPNYISKDDKYLLIEEIRKGTLNSWVKKKTLIDIQKKVVIGHYLVDLEGNNIASAEIVEFQVINELLIPKKMKFCWYQENKTLYWNFYQTSININIDSINWIMPNYRKTNDLIFEQ